MKNYNHIFQFITPPSLLSALTLNILTIAGRCSISKCPCPYTSGMDCSPPIMGGTKINLAQNSSAIFFSQLLSAGRLCLKLFSKQDLRSLSLCQAIAEFPVSDRRFFLLNLSKKQGNHDHNSLQNLYRYLKSVYCNLDLWCRIKIGINKIQICSDYHTRVKRFIAQVSGDSKFPKFHPLK